MIHPADAWRDDYEAIVRGAGLIDFRERTLVAIGGRDRAAFLHNFCTNAIRSLPVGEGREAFVLNAQGKTIGHVHAFVEAEQIVLETAPGQAAALIAHLDRYIVREDVTLHDLADRRREWLLSGLRAEEVLRAAFCGELPIERLSSRQGTISDAVVTVRRSYLTGEHCFWIECPAGDHQRVAQALAAAGAAAAPSNKAFDAARIEAGTPLFGRDVSDRNLPQELARDALAISFVKGCYLGQETVARIDALGHVNRLLRGVAFAPGIQSPDGASEPIAAGTELLAEGVPVGVVTSSCYSPRLDGLLALAFVKRGFDAIGSSLAAPAGPARVVALPL